MVRVRKNSEPAVEQPVSQPRRKSTSSQSSTASSSVNKKRDLSETNKKQRKSDVTPSSSSTDTKAADDGAELLAELDLEYLKLQSGQTGVRRDAICAVCEMTGNVLECRGTCQQSYHPDCVGLLAVEAVQSKDSYKCPKCTSGQHDCFLCKKVPDAEHPTRKCSSSTCGKYYHEECVKGNSLFRLDKGGQFTCPLHACATCAVEAKSTVNWNDTTSTKGRFVRCVRCPTAYHVGDYCLPPGSILLNNQYMVCTAHFIPIKRHAVHNRVNVTWCFVCCKSSNLIGCQRCPAAYHQHCLEPADDDEEDNEEGERERERQGEKNTHDNNGRHQTNDNDESASLPPNDKSARASVSPSRSDSLVNGQKLSPSSSSSNAPSIVSSSKSTTFNSNWMCEDCQQGKNPYYGQIVWAKVGMYRWWPAQICVPRCLPQNLREYKVNLGEFLVKFFGTHDYFWVTVGRCFAFAEGDECQRMNGRTQRSLEISFKRSVEEAQVAFKEVERLRTSRMTKSVNKYNFQMIKTNKPYGGVTINRLHFSNLPQCECDPKSASPCGSDETCLNRVIKYECHPGICPAGERCLNQRFVKRLYPKQEPFYTGSRGWGLKALVDIKKGDFVNEYVGEIINEDEYKRRLDYAHQNNIVNFYFLTIDKDRIIDAGPKGNLARFANHCCDPNMETQKWLVNGDIRVGLFARVDIPAGTELTFNYNLECVSDTKAECKCGAKNCSGFIGERPKPNGALNDNQSSSDQEKNGSKKRKLADTKANARSSLSALSTNKNAQNLDTSKTKTAKKARLSMISLNGVKS